MLGASAFFAMPRSVEAAPVRRGRAPRRRDRKGTRPGIPYGTGGQSRILQLREMWRTSENPLKAKFAEEAFYVIRCVKKAGAPKRPRLSLNGSSVPLRWPDRRFLHPIRVIFLLLSLSR